MATHVRADRPDGWPRGGGCTRPIGAAHDQLTTRLGTITCFGAASTRATARATPGQADGGDVWRLGGYPHRSGARPATADLPQLLGARAPSHDLPPAHALGHLPELWAARRLTHDVSPMLGPHKRFLLREYGPRTTGGPASSRTEDSQQASGSANSRSSDRQASPVARQPRASRDTVRDRSRRPSLHQTG